MKEVRVEARFELLPQEIRFRLGEMFEHVLLEEERIAKAQKCRGEWLDEILTFLETEGFDGVATEHAGTFYVRRGSKTTVKTTQVKLNLLQAGVDDAVVKKAWEDAKVTSPLETICVHRMGGEEVNE